MTVSGAAGELRRVVGLPGAVLLGLGSILGTGIFVSLGLAAEIVGAALPGALVAAGLVAACNGLSSAQLAAAHPVSGGTYEYAHRTGLPTLGFVAGWTFVCAKTASAATAALGFGGYLLAPLGVAGDGARVAAALLSIVALTLLVAGGMSRSSRGNAAVVAVTLAGLLALLASGAGAEGAVGATAESHADVDDWMQATAILFVAFAGYGRIATLGEEVRDPSRTIPLAIVVTLAATLVLYLGVAAVALDVLGADGLARATRRSAAPLEAVAGALESSWLSGLIALSAVTAMLGVLLNLLLGVSRVVVAMARRGDLPRGLARVDAASGSPRVAVLVTGTAVLALAATGSVRATWSFSAFTVLLYYAITNLAALRQPVSERRVPRAVSAFGLAACLALAPFVGASAWIAGSSLVGAGLVVRGLRMRGVRA